MRSRLFLAVFISICFVASYAQGDCGTILKTARELKAKGEYKKAVERYAILNKQCPNYVDEKIRSEWKACQNKLNSNKPSDQHVEVKPKPGSPTSPETMLDQYGRVKVSFDAGKATPICENVRNVIKKLEDYDTLGLQIEIPWCRDMYSLQLIEKRIRNITEIFIASGIDEGRVASKITMVDVLESCDGLSNDYDHDRIAEHITLINVEDGYNACDSAWLKIVELPKEIPFEIEDEDHVPIRDLSFRLARKRISFRKIVKREPQNIKILFDYDKDIPKIIDYKAIDEYADFLNNQSTYKHIVEGYTCDQGPEEHNRDLAQRRAIMVRKLFIEKGVDPILIETASYTVNDPQNRQNITNQNECDVAICRIVKR